MRDSILDGLQRYVTLVTLPLMLKIRDLTKTYSTGPDHSSILNGLDLDVARGEFVVILGRSGSGKSTLLNLVGAMDVPTSGSIDINGTALTRLDERARTLFRRRELGFVFQHYNLVPTLTVRENLLLPLELNGLPVTEELDALLENLGLADKDTRYADELSGGEQQRVAIARALIHNPSLIIADEPTGNLDSDTSRVVIELLEHGVRRAGKTLIMATHSIETLRHADRLLKLDHGRLVPH